MVEDKNKLVFQAYEKRAAQLIDKGYRNEVWYIGNKLLSDWTLLSRLDLTDKRVLNVGCSEPIDEMFWVRKVKEWVAVDYSPKSIEVAKKIVKNELSEKLARKIRFQIVDAPNLPFKNESFDIVMAFSTIEHILMKRIEKKP
jgi:ubiquinone/menaquinone biosynthesis C-methylase UbiE